MLGIAEHEHEHEHEHEQDCASKQILVVAGRQAGRCSNKPTLSMVTSTLPSRAYSACKAQLGPVPSAFFLVSFCSMSAESMLESRTGQWVPHSLIHHNTIGTVTVS